MREPMTRLVPEPLRVGLGVWLVLGAMGARALGDLVCPVLSRVERTAWRLGSDLLTPVPALPTEPERVRV